MTKLTEVQSRDLFSRDSCLQIISLTIVPKKGPKLVAFWQELYKVNSIIASLGKQAGEIQIQ